MKTQISKRKKQVKPNKKTAHVKTPANSKHVRSESGIGWRPELG